MPSKVIQQIEYDFKNEVLKLCFVSGLVYEYYNVPQEEYEQFRRFREKGIYFNQHIKSKYRFKKIN